MAAYSPRSLPIRLAEGDRFLRRLTRPLAILALLSFLAIAVSPAAHADSPSTTTTPSATRGVMPNELTVPAIGIDANVQFAGLADDGSMGVPVGFDDVAWYELGVEPGQPGNAIFTGHVSSTAAPGVFYNIDQLGPGNTIHVLGGDGTELVFIVQDVHTYSEDSVPMAKLLAPSTVPGVVLITCGGDWDPVAHLFSTRIVVTATLSSGS